VERFTAVDYGFNDTEKSNKRLFISFGMVFVLMSICLIAFCIYKSYDQKQHRLDLLKLRELSAKLVTTERELKKDR